MLTSPAVPKMESPVQKYMQHASNDMLVQVVCCGPSGREDADTPPPREREREMIVTERR